VVRYRRPRTRPWTLRGTERGGLAAFSPFLPFLPLGPARTLAHWPQSFIAFPILLATPSSSASFCQLEVPSVPPRPPPSSSLPFPEIRDLALSIPGEPSPTPGLLWHLLGLRIHYLHPATSTSPPGPFPSSKVTAAPPIRNPTLAAPSDKHPSLE
jgi:hypothetical protein